MDETRDSAIWLHQNHTVRCCAVRDDAAGQISAESAPSESTALQYEAAIWMTGIFNLQQDDRDEDQTATGCAMLEGSEVDNSNRTNMRDDSKHLTLAIILEIFTYRWAPDEHF